MTQDTSKTEMTADAAWTDADRQNHLRHDSLRVDLIADGEVSATTTLSEQNNWTYTFSDLAQYKSGKESTNSGKETDLDHGYVDTI